MTRTDTLFVWLLRVAWAILPITAGEAVGDAIASWSDPSRVVAGALAWLGWSAVLVALFVPRPVGLTVVRVGAPLALVLALLVAPDASGVAGVVGLASVGVALVLALAGPFSVAAANGPAYGDEVRFPLRIPPALFLGPLPIAVAAVGFGLSAGPLLLAGGQWIAGAAALVLGLPAAFVASRAVHGLSRRFAVLVPAGMVIADPAAIEDPVLLRRERIAALAPLPNGARPLAKGSTTVADLRLGAGRGALSVELTNETDMLHVRTGRRRSELLRTRVLWCTPLRRGAFLRRSGERGIRVRDVPPSWSDDQAAMPPPTSSSPS